MKKVKKIHFEVEYAYPVEMDDDIILDRFAEQILDDAARISTEDIEIVEET